MQYQCVSGDDHMDLTYIPARLWQERVPAKFKDQAPRIEETPEGRRWICEGKPWAFGNYGSQKRGVMSGAISRAGLEEEPEPWVFRPSTPKYRLEDMDRDRVDAQVIYGPPLPLTFKDPELRIVCLEAYNTWMAEFCSAAPERLLGIAMLPMHDVTAAVNELKRVAKLGGLRGALFGVFDAVKPVFHEDWEPLWAVASEAEIPISFHLGGGIRSASIGDPSRGQLAAFVSAVPMQLDEAEVAFQAFVDPYAKANVFLSITPHGIDVEEGYATFVTLPYDLTAKVGKFKANFGKDNTWHTHVRPWVDQPLVIHNFFGDEGLNDTGVSVSKTIPNP